MGLVSPVRPNQMIAKVRQQVADHQSAARLVPSWQNSRLWEGREWVGSPGGVSLLTTVL
jgi:hypothetical protein